MTKGPQPSRTIVAPEDRWQWLKAMLADPGLSDRGKVIGTVIFDFYNPKKQRAWPGFLEIAAATGKSESAVSRGVKDLDARAWISRNRPTRNSSYDYFLSVPDSTARVGRTDGSDYHGDLSEVGGGPVRTDDSGPVSSDGSHTPRHKTINPKQGDQDGADPCATARAKIADVEVSSQPQHWQPHEQAAARASRPAEMAADHLMRIRERMEAESESPAAADCSDAPAWLAERVQRALERLEAGDLEKAWHDPQAARVATGILEKRARDAAG